MLQTRKPLEHGRQLPRTPFPVSGIHLMQPSIPEQIDGPLILPAYSPSQTALHAGPADVVVVVVVVVAVVVVVVVVVEVVVVVVVGGARVI